MLAEKRKSEAECVLGHRVVSDLLQRASIAAALENVLYSADAAPGASEPSTRIGSPSSASAPSGQTSSRSTRSVAARRMSLTQCRRSTSCPRISQCACAAYQSKPLRPRSRNADARTPLTAAQWSIRLRHPQADQAGAREGHLHLRRRGPPADRGPHERHLQRARVRRRLLCVVPERHGADRAVYVTYSGENTFGRLETVA